MPNLVAYRRNRLVLLIIAWFLFYVGRAPYLGQWDSFDYLKQIVLHRLSDLGIGRPIFIGYNIVLWEALKNAFGLVPLQVESVVLTGIVLLGGIGVILFDHLARQFLPAQTSAMVTLAFLLSPLYAIYAGYVMAEIPMLVALLAAAAMLWKPGSPSADLVGGLLFGIAVGMREQALTLVGAFLWILWIRRPQSTARLYAIFRFGAAAFLAILAPPALFFLADPQGFADKIQSWLRILPVGETGFWKNVEASILFTFAGCPGAWIGLLGAGIYRWARRNRAEAAAGDVRTALPPISSPFWGVVWCLLVPLAVLWFDADVQIHPRYVLVVLPASIILCTSLYRHWTTSTRAVVIWAVLQLVAFGVAQALVQPVRKLQSEKKEYARSVRATIPGEGLLIAGSYSPVFDYYRGLGVRPGWRILWSGWAWNKESVASTISDSWARGEPIYLCDGPAAWFYFEDQRLDLHFILSKGRKELLAPGLFRIHPP